MAKMAKLVDALDLESNGGSRESSILSFRMINYTVCAYGVMLLFVLQYLMYKKQFIFGRIV